MVETQTSQAGELASPLPHSRTNPPRHILLVGDDLSIRQLGTKVLSRYGYEVDAAEDGAAGWQALHANRYDFLITDNNMPNLSGIELVKKMRSARLALPVILASGTLRRRELNQDLTLQLAATLPKPFTPEELLDTVNEVLRMSSGARAQLPPPPNWPSQPSAGAWQSPFIATHRFQSWPPE